MKVIGEKERFSYFLAENGLIFVQIHFPFAAVLHFFLNCVEIGGADTTAGVKPPLPSRPKTSRDIPLGLFSRTELGCFVLGAAPVPDKHSTCNQKRRCYR